MNSFKYGISSNKHLPDNKRDVKCDAESSVIHLAHIDHVLQFSKTQVKKERG